MKCLQCAHLNLQAESRHAREGFGVCAKNSEPGKFFGISRERQCNNFAEADAARVAERESWWANQQIRLRAELKESDRQRGVR